MSLIVTGGTYEQPSIGLQPAIFARVEDIGTHQSQFGEQNQIVIVWELSEKMREGDNAGKSFVYSEYFTKTISNRSNLGKMLASFRGKAKLDNETIKKGIDLTLLIGRPCQLNFVEREDGRIIRDSILPLPETMKEMAPALTIKESPEWIIKKREQSKEFKAEYGEPIDQTPADDTDLPF